MSKFRNNHLISTLFHVKGNPRICLFTEPLWGIPYNLYIPFTTLYMYALGVKDEQIGLLVSRFSLVPTVRGLYAFSFVFMTIKFFVLYIFSTETTQGKKRIIETKQQSIWSLFMGYKDIFLKIINSRQMVLILSIFIVINISSISINNFFGLYITQKLNIPDRYVALFPISRAIVMLLFSFIFQSWINRLRYRPVMLWGFVVYIASHLVLLFVQPKNAILIIGYTILEAESIVEVAQIISL